MVNIVKFAQFYCIYLLSSEQMSAGEKQIRCFYKKQSILWWFCPVELELCIQYAFSAVCRPQVSPV